MNVSTANFAVFDSSNLTQVIPDLTILGINPSVAERSLSIAEIILANKNKVSNAPFTKRTVSLRCSISTASRGRSEAVFDDLMALLMGEEKELWIPQSNTTRKYFCTYSGINWISRGGSYLEFELLFTCSDVFGYDTAYTTIISATAQTLNPRNDALDFKGSAKWQTPYIRIKVNSATGGTNKTITVGNGATGQSIIVTGNWVAGTIIEIDTLAGTVKVNGTEVSVSWIGAFPKFTRGLGTLTMSHNLTSLNYDIVAFYYKRYV